MTLDDEAMRRLTAALARLKAHEPPSTVLVEEPAAVENGQTFGVCEADLAAKPARELDEGARLGRFQLQRELGRGGFGVVYLALDAQLGRRVALKTPRPDRIQNAALWRRFAREARLAAALDHPAIVPVLDAGVLDGVAFIASAYQEGCSLSQWLTLAPRGFPPRLAAGIAEQLAAGLTHAHQRGVLHRDLKPGNVIMIGEPPHADGAFPTEKEVQARITDFGLGIFATGDNGAAATGLWMGSPPYMAPEQALASDHPIDVRADIYALGAILYEMLTGKPIYPQNDLADLAIRLSRGETPTPPRRFHRDISRDLETVCLKCLAHEPAKRYPSAAMLLEDLRRHLDGKIVAARRAPLPERLARWARRNPSRATLAGVVLLAAAVGEVLVIRHHAELETSNARLESVNHRLADSNHQLHSAQGRIQATLDSLRDHEARLQREIHASDLAAADSFLAAGDVESAQLMLLRRLPDEGRPDLRGFVWSYLWEQATRDFSTHPLNRDEGWTRTGMRPDIDPNWWTGPVVVAREENNDWFRVDRLGPRIDSDRLSYLPYQNGLYARWDWVAHVVHIGEGAAEPEPLAGRAGLPCFAADGRTLLLAERDQPLKSAEEPPPPAVRERQKLPSGREIDIIRLPTALRLTISADGQTAALWTPVPGSEEFAPLIYDLATGRGWVFPQFQRPARINDKVWAEMALSADGSRLAISGKAERLTVLDARDGRPLWSKTEGDDFAGPEAIASHAAFSADGRRLATCDRTGRVLLWDAETGERLAEAPFSPHGVGAVGFYPDDETVVALSNAEERLRSWSITPKSSPRVGFEHGDEVWDLAFIPGTDLLASGGDDHLIELWDVARGEPRATLRGHETMVTTLAAAPDGRILVSADFEGHLLLWDVEALESPPLPLPDFSGRVRAMAWSPDGRFLAVGGDADQILVWEPKADRWIPIAVDRGNIFGIAWSPDGETLAAGGHKMLISLWSWPAGAPVGSIETHAKITCVHFTPDGRALIASTAAGDLRSWRTGRLDEPQISLERNSRPGGIWGLTTSPDGRMLVGGRDDGRVFLWDPETLQQTCRISAHKAKVQALAFSPDGRKLATADFEGKILIHAGLETIGPLQLPSPPSPAPK